MSLFVPSTRFDGYTVDELVLTCDLCSRFYARCPRHASWTCHRNRVVYTDGACSNNGRFGALAGIGVAFGEDEGYDETHQFSFPVDDILDPDEPRTSQRAELLAALVGLQKICDITDMEEDDEYGCPRQNHAHRNAPSRDWIIIATDSKYVVSGMTEWLPRWRENGFLNSRGRPPVNLDLFLRLEDEIEEREGILDCEVKFWHIDREYNTIADELARRGVNAAYQWGSKGVREIAPHA